MSVGDESGSAPGPGPLREGRLRLGSCYTSDLLSREQQKHGVFADKRITSTLFLRSLAWLCLLWLGCY